MQNTWSRSACVAALVWSLAGAALGAVPPADEWLAEARALVEAFALEPAGGPRADRIPPPRTSGTGAWAAVRTRHGPRFALDRELLEG